MQHPRDSINVSWQRRCAAWGVHIFTASGACVGLMALYAIYMSQLLPAFWLMGVAVVIDAVDGMLARSINVKEIVPSINGELLDNIVDFFTYTIVPAFFILVSSLVPNYWCILCVIAITLSSAYQFTQVDAKTSDHFFKGFPSYWNIVVFYLFFWQMDTWLNFSILMLLSVLSFVPIKYIYPSRLDYLTHSKGLRYAMLVATGIWGLATAGLMYRYPASSPILVTVSMLYMILYVGVSIYRTLCPLATKVNYSIQESSVV